MKVLPVSVLLLAVLLILPCAAVQENPFILPPSVAQGSTPTVATIYFGQDFLGTTVHEPVTLPIGSTYVLPSGITNMFGTPLAAWRIDGIEYPPGAVITLDRAVLTAYPLWEGLTADTPVSETCIISFSDRHVNFSQSHGELGKPAPVDPMPDVRVPRGSAYTLPACLFTPPQAGTVFLGWRVFGQVRPVGYTIVPELITNISAVWASPEFLTRDTMEIKIQIDAWSRGGTVYPSGTVQVKRGESLTIHLQPDPGYKVVSLGIDGLVSYNDPGPSFTSFTFDNVISSYSVNVWFGPASDADTPHTPVTPDPPYNIPDPVAPPASPTPPAEMLYADVPDDAWFAADAAFVTARGLMNGVGDGLFAPDQITNRAMLVTILWREEGAPPAAAASFTDVPAGTWYTDAVSWAAACGIVNGYGDDLFGPEDPLTREQVLAILHRYARVKGRASDVRMPMLREYSCSAWAEDSVIWGENSGLLDALGVDVTDLTAPVSRAEAAAYLRRFCENVLGE